jgi:hypothetical protein
MAGQKIPAQPVTNLEIFIVILLAVLCKKNKEIHKCLIMQDTFCGKISGTSPAVNRHVRPHSQTHRNGLMEG